MDVMQTALNGYISDTGVDLVDGILNRGGINSMMGTVGMIILACMMGGALQATGALSVIMDKVLLRKMNTPKSLVIISMIYNYLILAVSGNQMLGAVMSGPTFSESYDKMNIHRKVLSRCMGDTAINGSALIRGLWLQSMLSVSWAQVMRPLSLMSSSAISCRSSPLFQRVQAGPCGIPTERGSMEERNIHQK